jgi:hypothetical protein
MIGIVKDRTPPECKTNIFLGPPRLSKLDNDEHFDSSLESDTAGVDSTDTSDCIVFFINEANLCQSPQVRIKVGDNISINAIIGCQLLKEYGININFGKGTFSYVRGGVLKEYTFAAQTKGQELAGDDSQETRNSVCPDTPYSDTPTRAVNSCSPPSQTEAEGCFRERKIVDGTQFFCEEENRSESLKSNNSRELIKGAAGGLVMKEITSKNGDKEEVRNSQRVGYISGNASQKGNLERRYRKNLTVADPIFTPTPDSADPRSLQRQELIAVVEQVDTLCDVERWKLYEVLVKYLSHMTTKPGRCNLFKYKFVVNTDKPIIGYSRPIPFATRSAVWEQIDQMLRDDILETSASPILTFKGRMSYILDAR